MNYAIKSRETRFADHVFRSRLEATWAAFFSLVGWQWEYEPVDLKGWVPDFALIGRKEIVLVEVKPIFDFGDDARETADKIIASKPSVEVLMLGATVGGNYDNCTPSVPILGWLLEDISGDCGFAWNEAVLGRWGDNDGPIGFCSAIGSFHDRITGGYDGGCYGCGRLGVDEIRSFWGRAKEMTRFMVS